MNLTEPLKVGDVIVRFGQVHKVFKVEEEEKKKGETRRIIHYKHFYPTPQNRTLVFSIPEENIERAAIRKPLTKKELQTIFKSLKKREVEEKISINSAKAAVNADDPQVTFEVLQDLKSEDLNSEKSLPLSKREVWNKLFERMIGEIAFVLEIKKPEAKKKLNKVLEDSLG
jgi:RNA polymerase-interacting CarD/CdnL/TRCF family regulator